MLLPKHVLSPSMGGTFPLVWCQVVALPLMALIPREGGQDLEPSSLGLSLSPSRYMRPKHGTHQKPPQKGTQGDLVLAPAQSQGAVSLSEPSDHRLAAAA